MKRNLDALTLDTVPLTCGYYLPSVRVIDEWANKDFYVDSNDEYYFVKLGDLIIRLIKLLKDILFLKTLAIRMLGTPIPYTTDLKTFKYIYRLDE